MRLAVIAAVSCSVVGLAVAADAKASIKMSVNIPAEPLDLALKTLAKDRGFQMVFRTEVVGSVRTRGAHGQLTTSEALSKLLEGTHLSYAYLDENTVTITPVDLKTGAATSPDGVADSGDTKNSDTSEGQKSGSFLLAQVAQGGTPDSSAVGKENDQASSKDEKKSEELEQIVVTGTHIRGVSPTSPVITIDREEIERSGYTTIGDVLRSLPQNSASGQSPQTNIANSPSGTYPGNTAGTAPNLRGIGNTSTLTLVDGYRLPADSQSGAIDVTLIPLAAVDRVEVVTDGASAIYGSDAVAGVVNIILKKHYDGAITTASVGAATEGGAFDWRAGELVGKDWDSGGGILVFEHEQQNPLMASQRSFTSMAAMPTTLLPPIFRNSLYLSGEQNIVGGLSAFAEGLYTSRNEEWMGSYADPQITYAYRIPNIESYLVTGGVNAVLPHDWRAKAFASVGGQDSSSYGYDSSPYVTPYYTEFLRGKTQTVEIDADGMLARMPTGDLRAALGAGDRLESYADFLPPSPYAVNNQRRVKYGFAELSVPLAPASSPVGIERLDFDISARYEDYSDFGSRTLPRFGILYQPIDSLKVRASRGKSFRAPTFVDLYKPGTIYLFSGAQFGNETPGSTVMGVNGGNPTIQPETATSDTVSIEFAPTWIDGFRATATYFNIDYRNRIGEVPDEFSALVDPAEAPFVTLKPSAALQQSFINDAAMGLQNISGGSYVPSNVVAIVDGRQLNYGRERIQGADLGLNYTYQTGHGELKTFLNGTYIELRQQLTPESPPVELAGTSYSPPHFRARGGETWVIGGLSATAYINYMSHEVDTYQPGLPEVSAWTTIDAQITYVVPKLGRISGTKISLSVQNLFDRAPPYVPTLYLTGLNYDPVNASPLGRYITLQASVPVSW